MKVPKDIDEYIAGFPQDIQVKLEQIRTTVKKAAPKAEESIKYGMPAFILNGHLVYFSAFKKHIGFYPVPTGAKEFKEDFSRYKTSGKGTIQFPLDQPVPLKLINKIVKFRMKEKKRI